LPSSSHGVPIRIAGPPSAVSRATRPLGVAGDVADRRVELRDRDRQPLGRTLVHE
jgi:hypothetical protein